MNEERVRELIREEMEKYFKGDKLFTIESHIQMFDGRNFQFGKTTGTKIGTSTDQKLGFYGKTPIVRPARPTDAASIIVAGTNLGLWA